MDHGRTPNLEEEGRSSVGGREGGTGGKKRARKRNNRRAKATKPSYLSSLSSTPTAPPPLPPAFVFYIHLGSQSREETEKREEAPLPSFSPSPLF